MKVALMVLGVLLLLGLLMGGKVVSVRNDLVTQREGINGAWAQVDVALQRRADLIPNLVQTVKGFAAQEKGVLESIANARAALVGARTPGEKIQANTQLDAALGRLLVVVENYPALKSNENFLRLQDELAGYFAGALRSFSVPLVYPGSPFQQRVWEQLLLVPYGETRSYQDLASAVGNPAAVRAVGRANGLNRIAILIPCHRIVNKNGDLGGYGGGLRRKQYLLNLEQVGLERDAEPNAATRCL